MKWVTLSVGAIIIIGGGWLLLGPDSANGPAPEAATEEIIHTGGMEDGTLEMEENDGVMNKSSEADHNSSRSNRGSDIVPEKEPQGDPIFHALIEYTDEGFVPASVTISKGETVRFVNQATAGMWASSDNHPTHTNYPEKKEDNCLGSSFDTCRALAAGEFWEFTFDHAGSWDYHNHVRARDGGTIIVK